MILNGDGPCETCNKHIWNIPVDGDIKFPDGNGGWYYKIMGNQCCLDCGQKLGYLHVKSLDRVDENSIFISKKVNENV